MCVSEIVSLANRPQSREKVAHGSGGGGDDDVDDDGGSMIAKSDGCTLCVYTYTNTLTHTLLHMQMLV